MGRLCKELSKLPSIFGNRYVDLNRSVDSSDVPINSRDTPGDPQGIESMNAAAKDETNNTHYNHGNTDTDGANIGKQECEIKEEDNKKTKPNKHRKRLTKLPPNPKSISPTGTKKFESSSSSDPQHSTRKCIMSRVARSVSAKSEKFCSLFKTCSTTDPTGAGDSDSPKQTNILHQHPSPEAGCLETDIAPLPRESGLDPPTGVVESAGTQKASHSAKKRSGSRKLGIIKGSLPTFLHRHKTTAAEPTTTESTTAAPPTLNNTIGPVNNTDKQRDSKMKQPDQIQESTMDDSETTNSKADSSSTHTSAESSCHRGHADRRNWDKIRAIPALSIRKVVAWHCNVDIDRVAVTGQTQGTYHYVVYVVVLTTNGQDDYVIRIPAHGIEEEWKREDMVMLENEARLMRYIRKNTNVPVPEVLAWNETLWNMLAAPYIMMRRLPGKSAFRFWFLEDPEASLPEDLWLTADYPSIQLEEKRQKFLQSLARHMAELGELTFSQIGMPIMKTPKDTTPVIGPSFHWSSKDGGGYTNPRGPFHTTKGFVNSRMNHIDTWVEKALSDGDIPEGSSLYYMTKGHYKALDIIFSTAFPNVRQPPYPHKEKETFTLRHNDLDLQNILIDDEGNVTGIIDWDRCLSVPRCVGAAAVPKFLQADWFPDQDLDRSPHMPWKLQEYRKDYAIYLSQFGCEDAPRYTAKSAIYQAALYSITETSAFDEFVSKVISAIPALRGMDCDVLMRNLGYGWPAFEGLLRKETTRLFAPDEVVDTARHQQQRKKMLLRSLQLAATELDEMDSAHESSS